ncbi:MAG: VWA domain-containing protein, partial [Phycisphaerales bacterium]|nr:VWA domain-containing protein [Phycisphaerales bacterium]
AAELLALNDGSMPSLGAGGSSSGDMSMGGGGAGASFFGVSSTGQRFLFIVDVSGSMQEGNRIHVAMRELSRSISELPDFAYFYVILYNHEPIIPRFQRGWQRARPREVDDMLDYLRNVTPGGGTVPVGAFAAAFALDVPPDVIFFLTDGLIPQETPDRVRSMNARGKRVVINTIAFGDQSSADLLKRISDESGGRYRFVPVRGGG